MTVYPRCLQSELPECCKYCRYQERWSRQDKVVRMMCKPELIMVSRMLGQCYNFKFWPQLAGGLLAAKQTQKFKLKDNNE